MPQVDPAAAVVEGEELLLLRLYEQSNFCVSMSQWVVDLADGQIPASWHVAGFRAPNVNHHITKPTVKASGPQCNDTM
jgi:hypothetical protein